MDSEFRGLKKALASDPTSAGDPDKTWPDLDNPQELEDFEKLMAEVLAIKGEMFLTRIRKAPSKSFNRYWG
jgi:hypothetical protein